MAALAMAGTQALMVGEGDEQVLHLRVSQATILGVTARLEQDAAGLVNIGFWTSIEDAVLFTVTAPRAGRYDVALCYACPAEEAGSQVVLESEEGAALTIAVQATGGFDRYVRHQAPRPLRLPPRRTSSPNATSSWGPRATSPG